MREHCKTLIVREPVFHSKFCTKRHPHHKKIVCSWSTGGGGGASGAEQSSTTGLNRTALHPHGGIVLGVQRPPMTLPLTTFTGHEHDHPHEVPGPIVGAGLPGVIVLAVLAYRFVR